VLKEVKEDKDFKVT
jgi:hypothetical protein